MTTNDRRRRGRVFGIIAIGIGVAFLLEKYSPAPSSTPSTSAPSSTSTPASSSTEGDPVRPDPPVDDRIEIPLDDADLDQEASLRRNLYFIFDGSGSMKRSTSRDCRGDQRFDTKIEGARWAVREFLNKVPDEIAIGLYAFDKNGREERVPLGIDNRDDFLGALDQVRVGGGTPLAEGIQFGTQQLVGQYKQQLGYGEFRLVVVTDGQADHIPEAARLATRYGMPIYAIGLCIGEDHPLRTLAVSYRAADNFADLAQGLEETLAELPNFDVTSFELDELDTELDTELDKTGE